MYSWIQFLHKKYKSNPLYPLIGKDKIDIMTYNEPKSFTQRGAIDKFVTSLLGVSENIKSNETDKDPTLKIPFTVNEGEIAEYYRPDLRISGFGVWFSGIYILSLLGISYIMYKLLREKKYELLSYMLAFLAVTLILVVIVDGSWWARYVPYVYLLPILVCVLFANQEKMWYKALAGLICILLTLNLIMVGYTAIKHALNNYISIEKNINNMKKISRANEFLEVSIRTDGFPSLLYNFRDRNITVRLKQKQELEKPKYVNYFFYNNLKIEASKE